MRPDSRQDVEIAGWSSSHTRLTFAAQTNPLSGLGARRDIDPNRFCPQYSSRALACGAWISW